MIMEENRNIEKDTGEEQPTESIPEEIVMPEPEGQPGTSNIKPQTENMEVHHHSHQSHGKKNWKSYFWEFLMLFLAVFCGFLAEYQLEHVIENQREKTLMRSLTQDLKTDSTQLQTYISLRTKTNQYFDSLLLLLSKPDPDENAYFIYTLTSQSTLRFGLPDISERTILQLKNAGGLRLIRSEAVSDAINKHYMSINRLKSYYETERFLRLKLVDSRSDILDASLAMRSNEAPEAYRLLSKEKLKINRFMNDILAAKQINRGLMNQLDSARVNSSRLKQLIEKEYHLE